MDMNFIGAFVRLAMDTLSLASLPIGHKRVHLFPTPQNRCSVPKQATGHSYAAFKPPTCNLVSLLHQLVHVFPLNGQYQELCVPLGHLNTFFISDISMYL